MARTDSASGPGNASEKCVCMLNSPAIRYEPCRSTVAAPSGAGADPAGPISAISPSRTST